MEIKKNIVLLAMFTIVLYLYIYSILKLFKKKKMILPILMILLIILSVIGIVFIKDNVNYIFRNIILMLVFILGVVCLPLIILGNVILNEGKYKELKALIVFVLLIYTYLSNWDCMIDYANKIMINIKEYSVDELFTLREK